MSVLNSNGIQLPTYLAKGVVTSGHVIDLKPYQIGIFDNKTWNVTTPSGNGSAFFMAGGRPHTKDQLSKFYGGMTAPLKSAIFAGKDVLAFDKITASRPDNEAWVIGYGGASSDKSLEFEKGKTYNLKIRLFGEPAFRVWAKSVEKVIPLYTGCLPDADCDVNCGATLIGAKKQVKAWVKAINSNPDLAEIKGFKAQPVFSDYAATAATTHDFTLTLTDDGGVEALQDVQRAYPTLAISRQSFSRGVSVYIVHAQAASPATFSPRVFGVPVTNCIECTAGTFTPAKDFYTISRPLAGTEDLDDSTARQTFADAVGTQYKTNTANTIPTSGVNDTTDVITKAAHGYVTGQPVVYTHGGGAAMGGLTTATTYYVVKTGADTFKLATTQANAVATTPTTIDITSTGNNAQAFTSVITAKFLSQNGAVAFVELSVAAGSTTLVAYLADSVIKTRTSVATCTPANSTPVAWVEGAGNYTVSRTLTLVVSDEDCSKAVTIEGLTAHLNSHMTSVVSVTDSTGSDKCSKTFTLVQKSNPMKDEYCLSPDNPIFEEVPNYAGSVWVESDVEEAYDADVKVGIRLTAPFFSEMFSDCSFQLGEYYDSKPLQMEVSFYEVEGITPCTFENLPKARRVKAPKYQRGYGEWVMEDYIRRNSAYFTYMGWDGDVRNRETMDNITLGQIKRSSYYVSYQVKFRELRTSDINQKPEMFETVIYVEEADLATQAAIETSFGGVLSKFGVNLEKRV